MRGQPSNACALAHTTDHSHQGLIAGWLLWILQAALALKRRYPLLDLNREHVIVELRLQSSE
jgi:hypothetical protein